MGTRARGPPAAVIPAGPRRRPTSRAQSTQRVCNILWCSEQAQQPSARDRVVEHPWVGQNPMAVTGHSPRRAQGAVGLKALGAVVVGDHVDHPECAATREVIRHVDRCVKSIGVGANARLDTDGAGHIVVALGDDGRPGCGADDHAPVLHPSTVARPSGDSRRPRSRTDVRHPSGRPFAARASLLTVVGP